MELSKVLATINVNAPIEYDFEEARISNLFTEAAYELFKKYEFKSLLKKFDSDKKTDLKDIYARIQVLEDFNEVLDYFDKASEKIKKGHFSFEPVVGKEGMEGLLLVLSEETITYIPIENFVTEELLCSNLKKLAAGAVRATVMNLKNALFALGEIDTAKYFDISVAAYLLNPLKDTYNYDDIADSDSFGK